ncbi:response regulator [Magnetovibrio sp.]|uniref:response regulator n=1 Tax=Magnetovibrio sp. TaxID=2024836 RepID=UPI002F91D443
MSEHGYLEQVRFLIIDDNAFSRQLTRRILNQFGAREIHEAENGARAKDEVKSFKPDIIIVDWVMSPVNGMEFVRWLREGPDSPEPFTPVIMVTAYSHLHNIMQARDAGINEFLTKPISAKSLIKRVQSVIEKPRQFVRADEYFGPDRRRRDLPHRGTERRSDLMDDGDVVDLGPHTTG